MVLDGWRDHWGDSSLNSSPKEDIKFDSVQDQKLLNFFNGVADPDNYEGHNSVWHTRQVVRRMYELKAKHGLGGFEVTQEGVDIKLRYFENIPQGVSEGWTTVMGVEVFVEVVPQQGDLGDGFRNALAGALAGSWDLTMD